MADSRTASTSKFRQIERKAEIQSKIILFLGSILFALLGTYVVREPDFTVPQIYVLFLLFFSMALWVTEAIPPFAVGIMIVGFLVFFLGDPSLESEYDIDVIAFVHTWSDSVIWLILGGFFLAEGMRKSGLDKDMFRISTSKFNNSPRQLVFGLMLATGIASMFISNTATTAMMFAAVMPLLNDETINPNLKKAISIGIPAAASVGGMGTIIGSPPNAIAAEMINRLPNSNVTIGFLEWLIFGLPLAIVLIILFWIVLFKKFHLSTGPFDAGKLFEVEEELDIIRKEKQHSRKVVVGCTLAITVVLWLTDRLHPIPVAAVSGIPIIALTMLGTINNQDVRNLPWDTLMLVAGGLSLGLAMQQTGLSAQFVDMIKQFQFNQLVLMIVFSVATVFFSNIMSNTATVTILVPAAALISGVDSISLALIIGLSASCALFLPVSTPPNAIAYSTGMVDQKDFRLGGTLIGIGGPILIILWVLLLR